MGSYSVGLLESDAPPRQSKLCGSSSRTAEATPWGMAAAPTGSADDLGLVPGGPGRSVHLRMHNSSSPMVLLGRNQYSAGDRCSRQHLTKGSPLCIPSYSPDNAHTSQGEIVRPQGPPSGPKVACEDMVLPRSQSVGPRTVAATNEDGPPVFLDAGRGGLNLEGVCGGHIF